jgi:Uma2 family endonuclease
MSTQITNYSETVAKCAALIEQLPEDSTLILHGVRWEEYEELLEAVGEAKRLRLSYDHGRLQIMTTSAEHENYAMFFNKLMTVISLRLRMNIRFFGSATMKKSQAEKGNEPDACFYVQRAALIGHKVKLDFSQDPAPDIAVEVDVHHESLSKFPIYAALDVPEIWHYDGQEVTIYRLAQGGYVKTESSLALPLLTGRILTEFLTRYQQEGEFETLLAFEEWVQTQAK